MRNRVRETLNRWLEAISPEGPYTLSSNSPSINELIAEGKISIEDQENISSIQEQINRIHATISVNQAILGEARIMMDDRYLGNFNYGQIAAQRRAEERARLSAEYEALAARRRLQQIPPIYASFYLHNRAYHGTDLYLDMLRETEKSLVRGIITDSHREVERLSRQVTSGTLESFRGISFAPELLDVRTQLGTEYRLTVPTAAAILIRAYTFAFLESEELRYLGRDSGPAQRLTHQIADYLIRGQLPAIYLTFAEQYAVERIRENRQQRPMVVEEVQPFDFAHVQASLDQVREQGQGGPTSVVMSRQALEELYGQHLREHVRTRSPLLDLVNRQDSWQGAEMSVPFSFVNFDPGSILKEPYDLTRERTPLPGPAAAFQDRMKIAMEEFAKELTK